MTSETKRNGYDVERSKCAPGKFAPTLPSFVRPFVVRTLAGRLTRTFNDVSVALLAFVVKLNHEVRQVGDHGAPEATRARRKID